MPGKKCQAKKMPGKNAGWLRKMPSGMAIYRAGRKKLTRVGIAMPVGFFPTASAFSDMCRLFPTVSAFFAIGKNARILAFFIGKKMPEPWLFYPRKKCQHFGIFLRGVGNQ